MNSYALVSDLKKRLPSYCVQEDVPLSRLSTWKIGGTADVLVSPETIDDVSSVKRYAFEHGVPIVVIGGGSNILFDDAGFRGVVLRIGQGLSDFTISERGFVHAGAGVWTPSFVYRVARAGFSGCTHAIGIPGTLGGLVVMNGGTSRKGIGDHLVEVTVVRDNGEIVRLTQAECAFEYRSSALQKADGVVVAASFQYEKADKAELRQEMLKTLRGRNRKFPRKQPNCGSVFLSNPKLYQMIGPPGKVIEEAGLKGEHCGAAQISRMHANFIINTGGATSADTLRLIAQVRAAVFSNTGHLLECEVRHLLPSGRMQPAHKSAEQFFPYA
ncbi:UDP-N-acetylmuramate dehydrogenase [Pseudodesulfovibrio sediminis]|nr:UDP-N-acetylmuramate dehydrogenase [Pseudodesulfovibrio sediminis]